MAEIITSKNRYYNEAKLILLNFLVLSLVGTLLRYLQINGLVQINYKNLLEAHSHFAFSGVLLLSCITALCLSFEELAYYINPGIFKIFLAESYLLLIIFTIFGYKAPGIIASTLYLFTTYYLVYLIWQGSKKINDQIVALILRYAAFFFMFSTLALWCMGPLMALKFAGKPIYYNTVYFYLHFQYNGFFTFSVLALLVQYLSKKKLVHDSDLNSNHIHLLAFATLLSYFISTLWCNPNFIIRLLAFSGAFFQAYVFIKLYFTFKKSVSNQIKFSFLIKFILVACGIKILLMLIISIPFISFNSISNRHTIIGFLHLTFIGTLWLSYWYCIQNQVLQNQFTNGKKMFVFLLFYILSEILLFSSAVKLPFLSAVLNQLLIYFSGGMSLGILLILIFFVFMKSKESIGNK